LNTNQAGDAGTGGFACSLLNVGAGGFACSLLAVCATLTSCASHPPAQQARDEYTDAASCATCHAEIAKAYRETGMGRSFYRPTAATYPAPATFHHKASDQHYELSAHDGKFFQNDHQIDYVVGSGNHARTFLHRNPDGRFEEMPVSWYSEKGGYLAMSPGYDNSRQEHFRRIVPDDCLFCHNGYSGTMQAGTSGRLAEGIDCQRCHGPGKAHVESSGKAPIVNPARLTRDRQLDDCMQCHLETTSLRLPNAIRRYDRASFSYRPGEPLTDYELFFDHAPGTGYNDRFEVAHHAYRLRKSACFLKSQMTCTTCHDPHRAQTTDHFVKVCQTCHAQAHSIVPYGTASGSCLDCHMWKRRAEDAVHTVMTDHFIQRRKPEGNFLAEIPEVAPVYGGEVVPYYPAQSDNELYASVAQVEHESNLKAGIPRLEQAIAKNKPHAPDYYVELGKAWSKSGRQDQAIHWYEEALRHRSNFLPAMRELAASLALSGNFARVIELGEQSDTVVLTNLGNAWLRQGNADRARQILEKALALNPDLPEAANLLGLVWLLKQSETAAEASFRSAISIQPDMPEAHYNLANLLAGRRDYKQAGYHFQKAIANNPAYAEAHHSYGLLLALMRSFDRAMAELQESVRLDPNSAQFHIDLADALAGKGRIQAAVDEYKRAISLAPEGSPQYEEAKHSLEALRR
jgi:tetratricopeptide (TPR) repeat protein